jgi:hypothetical protein
MRDRLNKAWESMPMIADPMSDEIKDAVSRKISDLRK